VKLVEVTGAEDVQGRESWAVVMRGMMVATREEACDLRVLKMQIEMCCVVAQWQDICIVWSVVKKPIDADEEKI
jgi:hypothetical protein